MEDAFHNLALSTSKELAPRPRPAVAATRPLQIQTLSLQSDVAMEAGAFGLTTITLVQVEFPPVAATRTVIVGPSDCPWERIYAEHMHHLADPVVSEMLRSRDPFFWSELALRRGRLTTPETRVLRDAARFGFREGFVATRAIGETLVEGVLMCGANVIADAERARPVLAGVAEKIYAGTSGLVDLASQRPRRSRRLRSRQVECLHWAALGKTSTEIGMILSLSRKTVDEHIENACRAFGVNGRIQAVARAVDIGLIELR